MAAPRFDVIEVLTRAGAQRDAACAVLGADADGLDARLVSDVLRATGRVGATLETRRALVELCGLVRAIDAAERGRIDLGELRSGLAVHAARTGRFDAFHDARVLLRTLEDVLLAERVEASPHAVRAQLALLHRELREWLLDQLTGSGDGRVGRQDRDAAAADPRAPFRVGDEQAARDAHALVDELLHGAHDQPVTGLLGAAWVRGWSAVPIPGEQLGDGALDLDRLARAVELLDCAPTHLLQVERMRTPRWRIDGGDLVIGNGRRRSWLLPATRDGIALAAAERAGWTIVSTPALELAIVEGAGHVALLGPSAFVEHACGCPPLEAVARFREHVEALAVDDQPPADLLEVATRFGRLRRRSR